jgi:hypothetical protein
MVDGLRKIRREVEVARGGSRGDVARELSLAITHLEDAEMRLTRALVRQSRHKADAENAVDQLDDDLLAEEDTEPETAPDEPEPKED